MSGLIIIPARGGSERVPNKNLKHLNGKPLIYYSVKAAIESCAGRVIVSTNCNRIASLAKAFGADVPFLRPENLATSKSTSIAVILHTLQELIHRNETLPELIVFKPPTNPFLSSQTIKAMINNKELYNQYDSILSIFQPRTSALNFVDFDETSKKVDPELFSVKGIKLFDIERSQDRPKCLASSPACKITKTNYFMKKYLNKGITPEDATGPTYNPKSVQGYIINKLEARDIDDLNDFETSNLLLKYGSEVSNSLYAHMQ